MRHLLSKDACTLPNLFFVKNIIRCVIAKLNPSPSPMEAGWLAFRVKCQLVLQGALMCQLLLSLGWLCTLFPCKGIGISGSFVREEERERSILFELLMHGQPSGQGSKLWFASHWLTFFFLKKKRKERIHASGCSVRSLYSNGLEWLAFPECSSQPPRQGYIRTLCR